MKAVVKYGLRDGEVELREVPEPTIGPADVLLEVRAAGVCGSDVEFWRHKITFPINTPVIQGHEFCGVIAEAGAEVKGFAVGDRVVSETAAYVCGVCPLCRSGDYNLCPHRLGFGYGVDGAFTRLVKVPARCLHHIPESVSFDHACLTEPACVAYNALVVKSSIRPGEPVLILGPGPIGLFCVQVAKAAGAGTIVLVGTEVDRNRMEVGRTVGAAATLCADPEVLAEMTQQVTRGFGFPLVVDASGAVTALKLALDAVARKGQITRIGWAAQPPDCSLDPISAKAVRLQGAFSHTWPTWENVLAMIANGQLQMEPMISQRMTIDRWESAYRLVEEREAVKVVFAQGD